MSIKTTSLLILIALVACSGPELDKDNAMEAGGRTLRI